MALRVSLFCFALTCAGVATAGQVTFLPGLPTGLSGNGRYVLINGNRYDVQTGSTFSFSSLLPFWGLPRLISEDGKSIVAELIVGELGETQIYRLNDDGTRLALSNDGGTNASPSGMSANGNVVIGEVLARSGPYPAYRWINGSATSFSDALHAISGDGQVIFGELSGIPVYWTPTEEIIFGDVGWDTPRATAVNMDGSVVTGYYGHSGFRWTRTGGFVDVGTLPGGFGGPWDVRPGSITYDGSRIAGTIDKGGLKGVVWDSTHELHTVYDFLHYRGLTPTDWSFQSAMISGNGEALTGVGTYKGEQKFYHVWFAGDHLTVFSPTNPVAQGQAIVGTVAFATTSATARTVNLSAAAGLSVPATVTIPANAPSANFLIKATTTAAGGPAAVTATSGNLTGKFDVIIREPIKSILLSPTRIHGGKYTRATVNLNQPLRQATQFRPTPINGMSMPFAVNVPKNATSFSFNVASFGIQVDALQTHFIKVSSEYHTEKSATLQVFPPIGWMTVYPLEIKGGTAGLGRIGTTLAAPASGLTYSLRSLTSLISVPASVSIPEGGTQTQFAVNTLPVTVRAVRQIEARTAQTVKTVNVTLVP